MRKFALVLCALLVLTLIQHSSWNWFFSQAAFAFGVWMWMKEDGEVDRSKYYMNGIYLLHSKHGMELLHGKGDSNKTFSELCAGIDAFHEHQSALSQIADTLYEKKNIALKALDEKKGFEEAYPEMSSAIRGLNPKFVDLLFKA